MEIYEELWNDAASVFARGKVHIDPHLSDKTTDLRRGVTLVARPSPSVRDKVKAYLDRLAQACPEQYFYRPEELHITVLAIISGTDSWRREIRQLASYRPIISEVLGHQHSFKVSFRGVTASPGSVMIQGYPEDDGLARIRNELREAFARAGFDRLLDRRYKISTAHISVLRFRQPGVDGRRLMALLEEGRRADFGEMVVTDLQLIWGDWYASANLVRIFQEYRLSV